MKRIIALLLALMMCLSLCGCGGKTKLTMDNYDKYISVYADIRTTDELFRPSKAVKLPSGNKKTLFNQGYYTYIQVNNRSDNFNFEDVVIEVLVKGRVGTVSPGDDYETTEWRDVEETFTLSLDIGGYGRVFGNEVRTYHGYAGKVLTNADRLTCDELIENITYEVLSVSGHVSKA